jgi:hypothetical protein
MSAVARGARLGIEDLRAPAIPDAENFAAVPIFQNLFVEAKPTRLLRSLSPH